MSDETLDITNTRSKDATINLFKIDANQNSINQQILSISSMSLSFVADNINDHDHSSTRSINQQIHVVRLATAILQQNRNVESIDGSAGSQANAKRAYIQYDWAHARFAVLTDWFRPNPLFNDSQFEQVF